MTVHYDIHMDHGTIQDIGRDMPGPVPSPTGPIEGAAIRDLWRRGNRVATQAKRDCPVDTGRLRASIDVNLVSRGGVVLIRVGSDVTYARWVNDGTRFMAGRPFLTNALDAAR